MPTGSEPRRIVNSDGQTAADRHDQKSLEARLLRRLLTRFGDPPIEFELAWTGERIGPATIHATERVRISDRNTMRGLLRDTQIRFGDAYSAGQIEVEGDLIRFMIAVYRSLSRPGATHSIAHRVARWLHRPRTNSLAGSRDR